MNRAEFKRSVLDAAASGTLLTAKHDPMSIGTIYPGFRTVTVEPASGIAAFFADDQYRVRQYEDIRGGQSKPYFEVTPLDPTFVAGSGIPPMTGQPDRMCDRLVVVSGVRQGWHVFAEDAASIKVHRMSGELIATEEF